MGIPQTPKCVDGFRPRRYSVPTSTDWERKENGFDPGLGYGDGTENGLLSNTMETTERKTGLLRKFGV